MTRKTALEVTAQDITASLTYGIADPVDIILSVPYRFWSTDGKGFTEKENGIIRPRLDSQVEVF